MSKNSPNKKGNSPVTKMPAESNVAESEDAISKMQKSMDFLINSFSEMQSRLETLEKNSDKDSEHSGFRTPAGEDLTSLLEMGLGTKISKGRNDKRQKDSNKKADDSLLETKEDKQKVNFRKSLAQFQTEKKKIVQKKG